VSIFFLDCEWSDECLLSMALVPLEDGEYLYIEFDYDRKTLAPWVSAHVMPVMLGGAIKKESAQRKISEYLSSFTEIEIIADWPRDISHFIDVLFVDSMNTIMVPKKITYVVDRTLSTLRSSIPHNALYDAVALRADWMDKNTGDHND
jgi:hypothetical protein